MYPYKLDHYVIQILEFVDLHIDCTLLTGMPVVV